MRTKEQLEGSIEFKKKLIERLKIQKESTDKVIPLVENELTELEKQLKELTKTKRWYPKRFLPKLWRKLF